MQGDEKLAEKDVQIKQLKMSMADGTAIAGKDDGL